MADQPGYTRVPNALLELLPLLPDAECRVMLVIARKTIGWQKACDMISARQMRDATGLSLQGTMNGIEAALKRGILKRSPSGINRGYCYEIDHDKVFHEVEHLRCSTKQNTEQPSVPPDRTQVFHEVEHQVFHEVEQQKKDIKEKKERGGSRVARSSSAPKQVNIDSLHEGVAIYKRLTGKKTISPVTATTIAESVTDCPRFEVAATKWINAGLNPGNIGGILDWYEHPENAERKNGHRNGTHTIRQSSGRHSERGPIREADTDFDF